MTQNQYLKRIFLNGGSITPEAANLVYAVKNLRARVDELRQQGVFIITEITNGSVTYKGGRPNKDFIAAAYALGGGRVFRRKAVKQDKTQTSFNF